MIAQVTKTFLLRCVFSADDMIKYITYQNKYDRYASNIHANGHINVENTGSCPVTELSNTGHGQYLDGVQHIFYVGV